MKKLIFFLAFLFSFYNLFSQVTSDQDMKSYTDTYVTTAGNLTAVEDNTLRTMIINSKVNIDSLSFVFKSDSLIICYYSVCDTFVSTQGHWTLTGSDITNTNAGYVIIDSLLKIYPLPAHETVRVGRLLSIETDGTVKWVSPDLVGDTIYKLPTSPFYAAEDSSYYSFINGAFADGDSNDISSYRTASSYLQNWRYDFANAHYPDASASNDNAQLAVIGDSYGSSLVRWLKKDAQKIYGQGGGYESFIETAMTTSGYYCAKDVNWTFNVDLTDTLILTSRYAESSTAGATVNVGIPYYNKLRILYKRVAGGGSFSYQLGSSGTPDTISTDGATAAVWVYKNLGRLCKWSQDTVFIKNVSGTVRLYGFYLQNDSGTDIFNESPKRLEVHNLSSGGTTVAQFTGKDQTALNTLVDTLGISAYLMIWLDTEAEDPYTNYPILIDSLKSAKLSDYIIISPYNNYTSLGVAQAKKYRRIADDLDVGFINLAQQTGSYAKNDTAGLMADVTHFNTFGMAYTYKVLSSYLFPPTSNYDNIQSGILTVNRNTVIFPNSTSTYITERERHLSIGANNVFIGYSSGLPNTTGYSNTFIGSLAGENNTTGYNNTVGGKDALNDNTVGTDVTAFGAFAGSKQTTAIANAYIGRSAGAANVSGSYNTISGAYAYETGTDKSYNAIYGYAAGRYNIGDQNAYFGYSAGAGVSGQSNTSQDNVFIGNAAGVNSVSAVQCVAIGFDAARGQATSTYFIGNANTSTGYRSLYSISSGPYNTANGHQAGRTNSTGGYNLYLGADAGYSNATGSRNIFTGYRAGYNETGSSKSYWASDSTSWVNGMASTSKLLFYADQSNAAKSNHFMNIFAKVSIGAAKDPTSMLEVTGNAVVTGSLKSGTGSIADNDVTPDVSGYNTFIYAGSANSVSIDALDGHIVGVYYTIIGNSNTYTITIIDGTPAGGDSFNLAGGNWVGGADDVLVLYCKSADNFIEISRSDN